MTNEEVEELQRKQLQVLQEHEAMLEREKALKEGTIKFHYDSQRERVEAKRKASPGKGKMGSLRSRKQTDLFGVQVSSAIPFCIGKKEVQRKPKRPAPEHQQSPPAESGGTQRRDPKAEYLEHEARKTVWKAKQHFKNKASSDSEADK